MNIDKDLVRGISEWAPEEFERRRCRWRFMLLPMTVPLRTLSDTVEKIVQRDPTAERKRDVSGAVIKLRAGKRIEAIDIVGWPARTRTSNQTVMSGSTAPDDPEKSST
jgi:hypothetical protein